MTTHAWAKWAIKSAARTDERQHGGVLSPGADCFVCGHACSQQRFLFCSLMRERIDTTAALGETYVDNQRFDANEFEVCVDLSLVVSCSADPRGTTVPTERACHHSRLSDRLGLEHTDRFKQRAPSARTWSFNLPAHSPLAGGDSMSSAASTATRWFQVPALLAARQTWPLAPRSPCVCRHSELQTCCCSRIDSGILFVPPPPPAATSAAGKADPSVSGCRRHRWLGHRLLPQQVDAPARALLAFCAMTSLCLASHHERYSCLSILCMAGTVCARAGVEAIMRWLRLLS